MEETTQNPLMDRAASLRVSQLTTGFQYTGSVDKVTNTSMADEFPFELVEMKTLDAAVRSKVKVISCKQPEVRHAKLRSSVHGGNSRVKVAMISDVDVSDMSKLSRTRLKLRQWKAAILAQPTPLVEIVISGEATTDAKNPMYSFDAFLLRPVLLQKSRRGKINNEIMERTNSRRDELLTTKMYPKKKEFAAVLPR